MRSVAFIVPILRKVQLRIILSLIKSAKGLFRLSLDHIPSAIRFSGSSGAVLKKDLLVGGHNFSSRVQAGPPYYSAMGTTREGQRFLFSTSPCRAFDIKSRTKHSLEGISGARRPSASLTFSNPNCLILLS